MGHMFQSWIIGSSVPGFGSYIAKHDNKSACKLVDQCTAKGGQRKLKAVNARRYVGLQYCVYLADLLSIKGHGHTGQF